MRGRGAPGTHRSQSLQLQTLAVDGVRNHGAAVRALEIIDLADGVQPGLRRIGSQPRWIANVVDDLQLGQCGGDRVDPK